MPGKTQEDRGRGRRRLRRRRARAEEGVDRYIAGQLKAIYDEVAAEPIPDRLLQLLDRLDSDGKG